MLAWAALIVVSNRVGQMLLDSGLPLRILAPPIIGTFQLNPRGGFGILTLAAPLVAFLLVRRGPRLSRELQWPTLLTGSGVAAIAWSASLAVMAGWAALKRPMQLPGHYLADVGAVGDPVAFLHHFVERIDTYGTHVRGHPPGFLLVLSLLDRLGLHGGGWAAALVIAGGGAAVPAVLVTVRAVVSEDAARRAAPFLVLAPTALYVATTADALFAGVTAWSVALIVLAAVGSPGRTADRRALAGGLLLGVGLMLSYGLVLIAVIPVTVAASRRAVRPLVLAGLATVGVLLAMGGLGFSWLEGLAATRREYLDSVASVRPYGYFLVANLGALAVITGPATAAGLALLRERRLWLLVGGTLAAIALADLSGMSKGEVERIWLPFAVWLLPAAAFAAGRHPRRVQRWLVAQVAVAFAVQVGVRTHW